MKPGYRNHASASCKISYSKVIKPHLRGKLREISHLYTPEDDRNRGYGTQLLKQCCKEADQDGVLLMILPDTQKLGEWYARFGFRTIQESPQIMIRLTNGLNWSSPGAKNLEVA